MSHEKESFWQTYALSPLKSDRRVYSYIKDDIYEEYPCANKEVFEQELENFASEITYTSMAEDEVYHPYRTSLTEQESALKHTLKSSMKSLWVSFVLIPLYLLSAFGGDSFSGLAQFKIFILIFGLIPILRVIQNRIEINKLGEETDQTWLENRQFYNWLKQGSFQVIWLLPSILIICFVWQIIEGQESAIGQFGLVKPLSDSSSYYRLISAAFMHGNMLHIYFNISFLSSVSHTFLKLTSYGHLILVFTVSAIVGSLFSIILYPETTSVGASGGILGIYGFILAIALNNKDIIPSDFTRSLLTNIGFIAILGLGAIEIIDNGAHLGGLLSGIGLGMLHSKDRILKRINVLYARDIKEYERRKANIIPDENEQLV